MKSQLMLLLEQQAEPDDEGLTYEQYYALMRVPGPTITQTLAAAGYSHRRNPNLTERQGFGPHLIERCGRIKARLLAREVVGWLERRDRKLAALATKESNP